MIKKYTLLLILFSTKTLSQQLITSAGNSYSNSNFQISFSLGEPIIQTYDNNSSIIITQGFHQPILPIITSLNATFLLFPNPVSNYAILKILNAYSINLNIDIPYFISDENGRKILEGKITEVETKINLSQLSSGPYFLEIPINGKLKVIKFLKISL